MPAFITIYPFKESENHFGIEFPLETDTDGKVPEFPTEGPIDGAEDKYLVLSELKPYFPQLTAIAYASPDNEGAWRTVKTIENTTKTDKLFCIPKEAWKEKFFAIPPGPHFYTKSNEWAKSGRRNGPRRTPKHNNARTPRGQQNTTPQDPAIRSTTEDTSVVGPSEEGPK